jgi:hypothetical protein
MYKTEMQIFDRTVGKVLIFFLKIFTTITVIYIITGIKTYKNMLPSDGTIWNS